jgi:hypothetical protein
MPSLRIRVGASLDTNALAVFVPLEQAAKRARANIDRELNATAKTRRAMVADAKRTGGDIVAEAEREADKILSLESKTQRGRLREVERSARERIRLERSAMREVEAMLASDNARRSRPVGRGGAIGVGRRAAISVGWQAALAYGAARSFVHATAGTAAEYLEGLGLDLSIAGHAGRAQAVAMQAQAISSAGYIPGAAGAQGQLQNPAAILKEIQAAGDKTATSFVDVGDALREFVAKTGDLETGRAVLNDIARLSKATNTNLVDMAEASAEVSNHLGNVPNKAEQVSAVMRIIAGQGKLGAVEIKDLASQMAKIAASAQAFEGGGLANIGDLAILAQEAKLRGGAATATQAATSVARFSEDLTKKTTISHWTAAGLNAFADTGKTKIRSPEELILEALRFSHGNLSKLNQLFPNAMSARAVRGFAAVYNETGGTEADKLRAVHEEFDRLRHATLEQTEITRAFNAAMAQGPSQIQLANNRLTELAGKINEALLPAVSELAPAIEYVARELSGTVQDLAHAFGLDKKQDDEDREKRRRLRVDLEKAAEQELQLALQQQPTLVRGKHGAELQLPGIDRSHVDALRNNANVVNTKLAIDAAEHEKHAAQFKAGNMVDGWGMIQTTGGNAKRLAEEEQRLNELKLEANRTNDILARIETALTTGKVRAVVPQQPPPADRSGSAPANSVPDEP